MSEIKGEWNPRFVWFCRSKGLWNPADFDSSNGKMLEFTTWNSAKIREFAKVSPESFYHGMYETRLVKFAEYDKWLEKQFAIEPSALYEEAVKQKIEMDNHESDLYLKVTPESMRLIAAYEFKRCVKKFKSNIDNTWWFDIPFGYSPFWEKAAKRGQEKAEREARCKS